MLHHEFINKRLPEIEKGIVYTNWSEFCPTLTFDAFIEGLHWLADDEMTDGLMRRELGCHPRKGLVRMRRTYAVDGSFYGLYAWDHPQTLNPHSDGQGSSVCISARDHIL